MFLLPTWPQVIVLLLITVMILYPLGLFLLIPFEIRNDKKKRAFVFIWLFSLIIVFTVFINDFERINSFYGITLLFLFIGLLFLPFIESLSVGNFLKINLKNLEKSIDNLRESILTFLQVNQQNNQVNNYFGSINTPDGSSAEIKTENISRYYAQRAFSLFNQKRYNESLIQYHKAYDADNNNWVAASFLGFLYLSYKDYDIPREEWGFNDLERLNRSIFFSTIATYNDPNHFMPFMNLGIAQGHWGGKNMLTLGTANLEKAYKMLDFDTKTQTNPNLYLEKAKIKSFIGEQFGKLNDIKTAIMHREEANIIFEKCPEPRPPEFEHWYKENLKHLNDLKSN